MQSWTLRNKYLTFIKLILPILPLFKACRKHASLRLSEFHLRRSNPPFCPSPIPHSLHAPLSHPSTHGQSPRATIPSHMIPQTHARHFPHRALSPGNGHATNAVTRTRSLLPGAALMTVTPSAPAAQLSRHGGNQADHVACAGIEHVPASLTTVGGKHGHGGGAASAFPTRMLRSS